MKLSQKSLKDVDPRVAVPRFDRARLGPGILHVGIGNFHRAHQAVYLNDLLNAGGDPAWGILGAGVWGPDAEMRSKLAAQDYLSSVVEVDGDGLSAQITGAMMGFLPVQPGDNRAIAQALDNPETRIVSLTVTEGGYYINAATGRFDPTHPAVAADIATPGSCHTIFGTIVTALAARRAAGQAPFTVMSCDNLPGNGDITRQAVLDIAQAIDPDLASWISDRVGFPNSMVDRITPATSDRERALMQSEFGIEDQSPVFCEPFRQWVMEDRFSDGRPAFQDAGVVLTDDIHDFEAMKIRILNGGHAIMAYPAGLMGIDFAHEAMLDPLIKPFLIKVLTDDVLPFVAPVPGYTPQSYLDLIVKRFSNPGVADTIARLCHDGSNRQPKFVIPSIRDNLQGGRVPHGLALASAMWCRYCAGLDDAGQAIAPNDPNWDRLNSTAVKAQADPSVWTGQAAIYGDLGQTPEFAAGFARSLASLARVGTAQTIRDYLDNRLT